MISFYNMLVTFTTVCVVSFHLEFNKNIVEARVLTSLVLLESGVTYYNFDRKKSWALLNRNLPIHGLLSSQIEKRQIFSKKVGSEIK